jgi:hypothetical protein
MKMKMAMAMDNVDDGGEGCFVEMRSSYMDACDQEKTNEPAASQCMLRVVIKLGILAFPCPAPELQTASLCAKKSLPPYHRGHSTCIHSSTHPLPTLPRL